MEVLKLQQNISRPRTITHVGKFPSMDEKVQNYNQVTSNESSKLYTTNNEHLPTGFVQKLMNQHHFNQQIEVIMPNIDTAQTRSFSQMFETALGLTKSYLIECDFGALLSDASFSQFLTNPQGKLYGVSANTSMDRSNALCFVGSKLHISVDKTTFTTLGLSSKYIEHNNNYIFSLDIPSKKGAERDRLLSCLSSLHIQKLQLIVTYTNNQQPTDLSFPSDVTILKKIKINYGDGSHSTSLRLLDVNAINISNIEEFVETSLKNPTNATNNNVNIAVKQDNDTDINSKRAHDRSSNSNKKNKKSKKNKNNKTSDCDSVGDHDDDDDDDFMNLSGNDDDDDDSDDDDLSCNIHSNMFQLPTQSNGDILLSSLSTWVGAVQNRLVKLLKTTTSSSSSEDVHESKVPADSYTIYNDHFPLLLFNNSKNNENSNDTLAVIRGRTFLSPSFPIHTLKQARSLIKNNSLPFVCITIWGVPGVPCIYDNITHSHGLSISGSGESVYSVILLPNDKYIVIWNVDGTSKIM